VTPEVFVDAMMATGPPSSTSPLTAVRAAVPPRGEPRPRPDPRQAARAHTTWQLLTVIVEAAERQCGALSAAGLLADLMVLTINTGDYQVSQVGGLEADRRLVT
jgi:hypothetical protein